MAETEKKERERFRMETLPLFWKRLQGFPARQYLASYSLPWVKKL